MASNDKIAALIKLSHDLGREDRGLAILGEGNTSWRESDEEFVVKASGTSLGSIVESQFVRCRFSSLMPLLDRGEMTDSEVERELLNSRVDSSQPKPSVEALFHAYLLSLPKIEVVGHTHPIAVNALLSAGDEWCERFAYERRFPDEIVCCGSRSVLVPYTDPGVSLAKVIAQETEKFIIRENRPPRIILIQNHGLIACGPSTGSVLAATLMAEKAAKIMIGSASIGKTVPLTPAQVKRIDSRPDEHYRQSMLKL